MSSIDVINLNLLLIYQLNITFVEPPVYVNTIYTI